MESIMEKRESIEKNVVSSSKPSDVFSYFGFAVAVAGVCFGASCPRLRRLLLLLLLSSSFAAHSFGGRSTYKR